MRNLHLGCGGSYIPGWVNVDVFSNIKADAYHDVTNLPYDKESFDTVYVCHLAEHLHRHMVVATFNHWGSLLKPGGTLRLAVPNFEAICEHYQKFHDMPSIMGLLYAAQDNFLNRHTVAFDTFYLASLLKQAGFKDVRSWDWRTTEHRNVDDYSRCFLPTPKLPVMPEDVIDGLLMSLNLEATKP